MRTIQITVDEPFLKRLDASLRALVTTRSALIRNAVSDYLDRLATRRLENRHRASYRKKPSRADEFGGWESEQRWPE